jgi:hypothetical protein
LKISDPATAFRLPKAVLASIDAICAKEDLTRSQISKECPGLFAEAESYNAYGPEAIRATKDMANGPFRRPALKGQKIERPRVY